MSTGSIPGSSENWEVILERVEDRINHWFDESVVHINWRIATLEIIGKECWAVHGHLEGSTSRLRDLIETYPELRANEMINSGMTPMAHSRVTDLVVHEALSQIRSNDYGVSQNNMMGYLKSLAQDGMYWQKQNYPVGSTVGNLIIYSNSEGQGPSRGISFDRLETVGL